MGAVHVQRAFGHDLMAPIRAYQRPGSRSVAIDDAGMLRQLGGRRRIAGAPEIGRRGAEHGARGREAARDEARVRQASDADGDVDLWLTTANRQMRLLIRQANGSFADETTSRIPAAVVTASSQLALLEDFDHLYRYADLYDLLDGKDAPNRYHRRNSRAGSIRSFSGTSAVAATAPARSPPTGCRKNGRR